MKKIILGFFLTIVLLMAIYIVDSKKKDSKKQLPFIGNHHLSKQQYHTISTYMLKDQLGESITPETFKGKIYLANFFFTSCPGICLKMQKNMHKIYKKIQKNPHIKLLSHSVDPEKDTVDVLLQYAKKKFNITDNTTWHFVTGDKQTIYTLAQKYYFISVAPDELSPGGIAHGGGFVLVDKQKRIRGLYDGLNTDNIAKIIKDIHILLNEKSVY